MNRPTSTPPLHPAHPPRARRRRARPAPLLALLLIAAGAGCAKPLLSPKDDRSPFDRYDLVRNQYARQYVENEFGREVPNLRGRLTPK